MIDYLGFIGFKIFKFFVLMIPKKFAKMFLDCVAKAVYFFDLSHRKVCLANLDLVYGDSINFDKKIEITKNSYKNLIYNLYEFIENSYISKEEIFQKVEVSNEHFINDALLSGKPIIAITAHYGNWELFGQFASLKYRPMSVVGRMLDNDLLNKDLLAARNKNNCIMLDRNGASKGLVKAIKDGRMCGLVIDQHIGEDKGGVWIKVFGHEALQSDSPARLALKFDAIILPVFVVLKDFRKYEVKFCEPICIDSYDIVKITQLQSNVIEKQILEYPDIWFWQHKRWKGKFKHIYQ